MRRWVAWLIPFGVLCALLACSGGETPAAPVEHKVATRRASATSTETRLDLSPVVTDTPIPDPTLSPLSDTPTPVPTSTLVPPTPLATATSGPTLQPLADVSSPAYIAQVSLGDLPGFGRNPAALAVQGESLYVANMDTANVSVVRDGRVVEVLPVGAGPVALAVDPQGGQVYVLNRRDQSMTVLADDQVARRLSTGAGGQHMVYTSAGLAVSLVEDQRVVMLDPESGAVRFAFEMASEQAQTLAVDERLGLLLMSDYGHVWACELDTGRLRYALKLGNYITLASDPERGLFFVTDYDAAANQQYLVAVRTTDGTVLERAPVGQDPRGAAVNRQTGMIYVVNAWSNDVTVVQAEPLRVMVTIAVGMRPSAVSVDEARNVIYVANGDSDSVAVIDGDTHEVTGVIPLAVRPEAVAVDEGTGRAYVAVSSTNSVMVIDKGQLVTTWPVGWHPTALALDSTRNLLMVANTSEGTAHILDAMTGERLAILAVRGQPQAAAVDDMAGLAYVGRAVIDSDALRIVGQLELNATQLGYDIEPQKIVVDPLHERLFVMAFNGIPGSNGGNTIYALKGRPPSIDQIELQLGMPGVTDLALDAKGQRLFSSGGRFGYNSVYAQGLDTRAEPLTLELWKHPRALAYNEATGHLFVALTRGSRPDVDQKPEILILDGTLEQVATLPAPGLPRAMAVDRTRSRIFICDRALGHVFVIQDMP